jgi:hypothetical protein
MLMHIAAMAELCMPAIGFVGLSNSHNGRPFSYANRWKQQSWDFEKSDVIEGRKTVKVFRV